MASNYVNDDGTYTAEYWFSRADEAEAIADCMVNRVAKTTMITVAQSYRVLGRQAAATEERKSR